MLDTFYGRQFSEAENATAEPVEEKAVKAERKTRKA
jgi:acetaldehyde dehydrogenase/alcohol dehydrogenase